VKTFTVKELMVPLAQYATVSEDATLLEAVIALKKAQEGFDQTRYRHRAILVFDKNNHIVGKLSQHDVIKALEPSYRKVQELESLERFGISSELLKSMLEQYRLWDKPIEHLCEAAAKQKVKEIMYTPVEGEYIGEHASIGEAIHRLVVGQRHSLLVTRSHDIVGILRLTDVFALISQTIMK
jgi:CBS-domain-containing membrane protein